MNREKRLRIVGITTLSYILILLISIQTIATESVETQSIYFIGEYGYIQNLDKELNTIKTMKIPNLTRNISVRDADLSNDGKLIYLVISNDENPLKAIRTSDLTIDPTIKIEFPKINSPWDTYMPYAIRVASSRYLYISDESYSTVKQPFGCVLVDLHEKKATPVYQYCVEAKQQIEFSPNQQKMAINSGNKFYIINIPDGQISNSINKELINNNAILWFDTNWNSNIIDFYTVPSKNKSEKAILKYDVDIQSKKINKTEDINIAKGLNSWSIKYTTSSNEYILDKNGRVKIFNRKKGALISMLELTFYKDVEYPYEAIYVSPDDKYIFFQKNANILNDNDVNSYTHEVSFVYIIDIETAQIIKTINTPQKLVDIVFSGFSS